MFLVINHSVYDIFVIAYPNRLRHPQFLFWAPILQKYPPRTQRWIARIFIAAFYLIVKNQGQPTCPIGEYISQTTLAYAVVKKKISGLTQPRVSSSSLQGLLCIQAVPGATPLHAEMQQSRLPCSCGSIISTGGLLHCHRGSSAGGCTAAIKYFSPAVTQGTSTLHQSQSCGSR